MAAGGINWDEVDLSGAGLRRVDSSDGIRIGNLFIYYELIFVILACSIIPYIRIIYLIFLRPQHGVLGWLWSSHRTKPCKTFVVLGSGGHTAEMLKLLSGMTLARYSPRTYIAASDDSMSQQKASDFESTRGSAADIRLIPRARRVGQSYLSSVPTTLHSLFSTMKLVLWNRPDLLLCNGPGTCVPVCFWAFVSRCLFIKDVRVVYVESYCRVRQLSLAGHMVYFMVDRFLVQWPQLGKKYRRAEYIGRIM